MEQSPVNNNDPISTALKTYANTVRRICFLYLRDSADADDVFQEVFLKLLQNKTPFAGAEHEKAWLIRVTINKCKDTLKSFWRKNIQLTSIAELPAEDTAENELLQIVLSLPYKYKEVIHLYYYEDYTVPQIAAMVKQKENTIYSQLHRARALIKRELGGKEDEKPVEISFE
jgi:RNA polymerase sigma-70 factor (ECF subfamily)